MDLIRIDRLIAKCDSWDTLYTELASTKKYTQKFKGDVFERLTQAYLLTMPEYRSKLSNVWLYDEIPRNVLKKINLPSKDFGIDLIAKTNRDEYWTIQCKFKSTKNSLTYKELSTFSSLSFVSAKNINLGLISHSSNKPIRNRRFLGNVSEIGLGRWLSLAHEEWSNIRKFCKRKPVKLSKRKPRPHQRKAISFSKKHFIKNNEIKGKLIMPCATGKSLTAFWIAQSLEVNKIIVAVPSLSLIKQSLNDWTKEYLAHGIIPEWLCVCSDASAGKVEIDEFNTDTYDLGIPTTTNKNEIVKFLRLKSKSPKIIFTTYQSSPRLALSAREAKMSFDFAILDEAHKTVGVKGKSFSTLLFDKNIKIKKRLFMTATERVLRGKNDKAVSMDDKNIYGSDVYVMTFKDAIEQNIISDYKILTMAISDNEVNNLVEDNRYLSEGNIEKENSAQYLASGIALKKTFKKHKIKHAISFHRSIKLAKQFQDQQERLNKIKSLRPKIENLHISSRKSSGQRVELIKEFTEHNRSLLTNARCLTEGVDVPAIDCVMFVDPKQSTIDIVQASGRALRKYEGKDYGCILLPIVIPEDMDLEEFSETTAFKKIVSIITSLSSQDERIADEFRLMNKGRSSSGKIINIESHLKLSKKINITEFANFIDTKIWEKVAKINYRDFDEARSLVRSFNFKKMKEFNESHTRKQLPLDIPYHPERTYKDKGWISAGDWLGTGSVAPKLKVYRDFKKARKYVRGLKLKNRAMYIDCWKKGLIPGDIPRAPEQKYKDQGWVGIHDWLGTKQRIGIKYMPYIEAQTYASKLGLKLQKEWRAYAKSDKRPLTIPSNPEKIYKEKGWAGISAWLGVNKRVPETKYRDFKKAREFVRSLNLKSSVDWVNYKKDPKFPLDIPRDPRLHYKNKGWASMGDWLGTGRVADHLKIFRDFKEARKHSRKLKLKNIVEYRQYYKKGLLPADFPSNPHRAYKNKGWLGAGDWLGTRQRPRSVAYRLFNAARKYSRSLKLKSQIEWFEHTKSENFPIDIPKDPSLVYKNKGWINIADWLGYEDRSNMSKSTEFWGYKKAKKYVNSLNISSARNYNSAHTKGKLPQQLPYNPDRVYKNKGWTNWKHWLGN